MRVNDFEEPDEVVVYPRFGGSQTFPMKWFWQRWRFYAWYLRHLIVWNDPITHINDEPIDG